MAGTQNNGAQSTSLEAQFDRAVATQRKGDPKGALKILAPVLKQLPNHPQILNFYSLCLAETGEASAAQEALEKSVASNPDHASSWANLGLMRSLGGDLDGAGDAFAKYSALEPDSVTALLQHGDVCLDLERFEEAERLHDRAVALEPANANAVRGQAQAKMFMGKWKEGIEAADKVLAVAPGNTFTLSLKALGERELGNTAVAASLMDFDRLIEVRDFDVPDGYDDMASFNDALCRHALEHESLVYEPRGQATQGGSQTGDLTRGKEIGPVAGLLAMIEAAANDYQKARDLDATHPFLAQRPGNWSINLWATILDSQGHQDAHFHPSGWLSGVYYARIPDVITEGSGAEEGWIEFGRMDKYSRAKVKPPVRSYAPREGRVVLFPSYIYHSTKPFESEEKRISFAFDIQPA